MDAVGHSIKTITGNSILNNLGSRRPYRSNDATALMVSNTIMANQGIGTIKQIDAKTRGLLRHIAIGRNP